MLSLLMLGVCGCVGGGGGGLECGVEGGRSVL